MSDQGNQGNDQDQQGNSNRRNADAPAGDPRGEKRLYGRPASANYGNPPTRPSVSGGERRRDVLSDRQRRGEAGRFDAV